MSATVAYAYTTSNMVKFVLFLYSLVGVDLSLTGVNNNAPATGSSQSGNRPGPIGPPRGGIGMGGDPFGTESNRDRGDNDAASSPPMASSQPSSGVHGGAGLGTTSSSSSSSSSSTATAGATSLAGSAAPEQKKKTLVKRSITDIGFIDLSSKSVEPTPAPAPVRAPTPNTTSDQSSTSTAPDSSHLEIMQVCHSVPQLLDWYLTLFPF